jgi:NADH:ubiquinone oxidoreductase subunit 6 (subunit J)
MYTSILLFVFCFISYAIMTEIIHKRTKQTFSTIYFLLHLLNNIIIIIVLSPYTLTLFNDPEGFNIETDNYSYVNYCYIIINALHCIHLYYNYKNINKDELFHHFTCIIFYIMVVYLEHPIYSVILINVSGIPGAITYLMLYLTKINVIDSITEKKYSMLLNIWIRCPLSIMFSTFLYCRMIYDDEMVLLQKLCVLFIIGFNTLNGIYFMTTIIDSFYYNYYKNYYKNLFNKKSLI